MILWIALEWKQDISKFEIVGVFSTKQMAEDACVCRNQNCVIGPITLDEVAPKESTKWDGAYYPCKPE